MRRFLIYALALFLSFLLQTAVLPSVLSFTGIRPNALIILIVSFALMRGEQTGILLGFFSGLLCDLIFGDYLGFYALIFMFAGFIFGKLCEAFSPDRFYLALLLIAAGDAACGFVSYVLLFLLRARFHFRFYLLHVIVPEAVGTLVAALVLYPLYFWINKKLTEGEIRRAKKFV